MGWISKRVKGAYLIATHQDEGSSESGMAAITLSDYSWKKSNFHDRFKIAFLYGRISDAASNTVVITFAESAILTQQLSWASLQNNRNLSVQFPRVHLGSKPKHGESMVNE